MVFVGTGVGLRRLVFVVLVLVFFVPGLRRLVFVVLVLIFVVPGLLLRGLLLRRDKGGPEFVKSRDNWQNAKGDGLHRVETIN
jgi:hypothetical protein